MNDYQVFFTAKAIAESDPEAILNWSQAYPNFTPNELACKCCGALLVNKTALQSLQVMRNIIRMPLVITSGYRCPDWNTRVGGAENSLHKQGRAYDIHMPNVPAWHTRMAKVIYAATHAKFRGFGIYESFIHIDTGPNRFWQAHAPYHGPEDDTVERVDPRQ